MTDYNYDIAESPGGLEPERWPEVIRWLRGEHPKLYRLLNVLLLCANILHARRIREGEIGGAFTTSVALRMRAILKPLAGDNNA